MIEKRLDKTECISMGAVYTRGKDLLEMNNLENGSSEIMMDKHFIQKKTCRAFVIEESADFIDIGIPESYRRAQVYIPEGFA